MNITVRSGVDATENKKREKDPAYKNDIGRHAHVYLLGAVKEVRGEEKLPTAVNALAIARDIKGFLAKQGFVEIAHGQKPEIIITVNYGRGYLPNPYSEALRDKEFTNLSNTDNFNPPSYKSYHRLDERAVLASQEKLIIQVCAWKYPPPADPKKKPVLAWRTTMDVDDPDHRDLNIIYPKLLAAGAPFFDRHLDKDGEVMTDPSLKEGHVEMGTPEVVKGERK
ncbi:MAG: hypothetical protein JWM32_1140 [Verrucomicrobia bacterium]|nr:hypothetical protein [Verrucomicrobiota bacterium]